MKNYQLLLFVLIGALGISCSSEQQKPITPKNGDIEVLNGWARPAKTGMMSAAYFTLNNQTESTDTLLSVSSDASANTQMHESYETEDGLMGMREQSLIPVQKKSTVEFKQGGLHIMIIQPDHDLVEGDSVLLKLTFSSFKELEVKVPIKLSN